MIPECYSINAELVDVGYTASWSHYSVCKTSGPLLRNQTCGSCSRACRLVLTQCCASRPGGYATRSGRARSSQQGDIRPAVFERTKHTKQRYDHQLQVSCDVNELSFPRSDPAKRQEGTSFDRRCFCCMQSSFCLSCCWLSYWSSWRHWLGRVCILLSGACLGMYNNLLRSLAVT